MAQPLLLYLTGAGGPRRFKPIGDVSMKFVTAAAAIAMTLASCGNTAKQNASSSVKSEVAAKADYQCSIWSTLDSTVPAPVQNFQEGFEFKSTDTSITKIVGVTPGDQYLGLIDREVTEYGAQIKMIITNTVTKASVLTQMSEGNKNMILLMQPDNKFQVGFYCAKKP